ncbi:MAG: hypothetical protein LBH73_05870 [Spirochaetaceae bacterium]|jgi:hypothetical protein|nr:hypothetical protein [Spirochaetaceae bacterium]
MRIAVIVFPAKKNSAAKNFPPWAASLARGMEAMGHRVELMDGYGGELRGLPGYDYLALLTEPRSFLSGKIPPAISAALASSGSLGRKKGAAFIKKKGPFSMRALSRLMALMEKEGIIINWSDLILNPAQAEALGKRIGG